MLFRGTLFEYLVLALLPWLIVGLIIIYSHTFNHGHTVTPHSHPFTDINTKNNLIPSSDHNTDVSAMKLSYMKKFPRVQGNNSNRDVVRRIYLDWPLDSDDFAYLNYKRCVIYYFNKSSWWIEVTGLLLLTSHWTNICTESLYVWFYPCDMSMSLVFMIRQPVVFIFLHLIWH